MSNENSSSNIPRLSRSFEIVLYPDNDNHLTIIEQLLNDRRACGILHDRDVNDEGILKKPHYHFFYKFDNALSKGSLLLLYPNIESNLINNVKNMRSFGRYLLHLDDPEKIRYNESELVGNVDLVRNYLKDESKLKNDMALITDFIDGYDGYLKLSTLIHFLVETESFGAYRNFQNTFLKQLELHNKRG